MNFRIVLAVAKTTFREFWRSPEAVFWTYGFPLLMAVVLGLAFEPGELPRVPVAVVETAEAELRERLAASPRLQVDVLAAAEADAALARGRAALLVGGTVAAPVLRADPMRPEAELARLLVLDSLRTARDGAGSVAATLESETRPGARYIDFLVPGLVGLNLLGAGLWGVGFTLVQLRTQKLLRRLFVTPMRRGEFLLGFIASRLVLVLPEAAGIVAFGALVWGVPFRGSVLAATALVLAGAVAFTGLGVLIASRPKTIEGVAGLMNVCMLPMWLLGGVFFSNEKMEGVLGAAARSLPLSWVNQGLRDLMLEPVGFGAIALPVLWLALFAAACFAVALRVFRWT